MLPGCLRRQAYIHSQACHMQVLLCVRLHLVTEARQLLQLLGSSNRA